MKYWNLIYLSLFFLGFTCGGKGKNSAADDCIDPAKIDPDIMCIELWEPVCGCDGKTYSNTCYAERAGVTRWEKGECPE